MTPKTIMTIDLSYLTIAQMGGFMNRKSDGNPGWQSFAGRMEVLPWPPGSVQGSNEKEGFVGTGEG